MQADVQEIRTGTGRITALTHQLLDFTRLKASDPAPMEINGYLNQLKPKVQEIVGSTLLEWNLHPERIGGKAEPSELEQVLESLLIRARQVSGQHGVVSVATEARTIKQTLTRPGSSLRPGSYAVISIADQGNNIDEEARATLFESFLVSPANAQAYTIVRQWGGDIAIAEANHLGSTIDIYLPAATLPPAPKAEVHETSAPEPVVAEHAEHREYGEHAEHVEHAGHVQHAEHAEVEPHPLHAEAAPVAPPAPPAAPPPPPAQSVLLVEDESGIRALVRKILRRQGYEVIEAESGEQALELSRQFSGRIDLIVTDLMLPKIGGRELVAELQKEGHTMKVLYVSGYTDDPAVYAEQLPAGTAYLQKPFTLGSLLDKVKDVLGPQG
jgi:CheY-like chemotaxis protein